MAFCTGKKTLPVLYDTVFKKLMNPETHRERLEDCVSSLLGRKVKIKKVLPVEDIMMDGETIMVLDILVELKDGSLVLVEIQKVPYYFPAERASCYSADLLLRQYSSIKSKKGKRFSYRDLRKVYTIVIYEKSTEEFKTCSDTFIHHARTVCDTELELNCYSTDLVCTVTILAMLRIPNGQNLKPQIFHTVISVPKLPTCVL